jgi:hypothetical protein
VQAVEDHGEVAVAQLAGAYLVADAQPLQLLEQQRQIADLDVRAQRAGRLGALEKLLRGLVDLSALALELLGGGEAAGEPLRERAGADVDAAAHEAGEGDPRVAVVGECRADLDEVALHAVGGEALKQLVLAGVAAVEGPDPDTRPLRDSRDRRPGIGEEDLASGLEDPLVVARSLGAAAAEGTHVVARSLGAAAAEGTHVAVARRPRCLLAVHVPTISEQSIPFK